MLILQEGSSLQLVGIVKKVFLPPGENPYLIPDYAIRALNFLLI